MANNDSKWHGHLPKTSKPPFSFCICPRPEKERRLHIPTYLANNFIILTVLPVDRHRLIIRVGQKWLRTGHGCTRSSRTSGRRGGHTPLHHSYSLSKSSCRHAVGQPSPKQARRRAAPVLASPPQQMLAPLLLTAPTHSLQPRPPPPSETKDGEPVGWRVHLDTRDSVSGHAVDSRGCSTQCGTQFLRLCWQQDRCNMCGAAAQPGRACENSMAAEHTRHGMRPCAVSTSPEGHGGWLRRTATPFPLENHGALKRERSLAFSPAPDFDWANHAAVNTNPPQSRAPRHGEGG